MAERCYRCQRSFQDHKGDHWCKKFIQRKIPQAILRTIACPMHIHPRKLMLPVSSGKYQCPRCKFVRYIDGNAVYESWKEAE